MNTNRGKQFEGVIKKAFEQVQNTAVVRLHDQTNGFAGSTNPCDFIIYHRPLMYAIECKSVHGNRLPLSNISKNQRIGLLKLAENKGVEAGVICWYLDRDITNYIPIDLVQELYEDDKVKSIAYNHNDFRIRSIKGYKKRVFFDYDMKDFMCYYTLQRAWMLPDDL